MENKNFNIKNLFATTKQKVIALVSGIVLLAIIIGIIVGVSANNSKKVTSQTLIPTLELVGELTTAELNFKGQKQFKDDGIFFLNRSDFFMTYQATLRAGIDIEKVEININDLTKTIYITIPEAEIQEVKVLPDTIQYFDEKFSLFNFNSKEDANKAQAQAEEDAKEEALETGILDFANEHARTLIKALFEDAIPEEYTIEIK